MFKRVAIAAAHALFGCDELFNDGTQKLKASAQTGTAQVSTKGAYTPGKRKKSLTVRVNRRKANRRAKCKQ